MPDLRQIRHPGPVAKERVAVVPCQARVVTLHLRAGDKVISAITAALADQGVDGAYLRLDGMTLAPLSFVIPGPAPGDGRAAWYSRPYRLDRGARIIQGGLHLGQREGGDFVHCHAVWAGATGVPQMGHLLAAESRIAADCTVQGWALSGARFTVLEDAETGFALFSPHATSAAGKGAKAAFLVRLRPNQDMTRAVEAVAAQHGLQAARIEGIGSLVGTCFADGAVIDAYATEILLRGGWLRDGVAHLDAASIGFDAVMKAGKLLPASNAICVTAELLLIAETDTPG